MAGSTPYGAGYGWFSGAPQEVLLFLIEHVLELIPLPYLLEDIKVLLNCSAEQLMEFLVLAVLANVIGSLPPACHQQLVS